MSPVFVDHVIFKCVGYVLFCDHGDFGYYTGGLIQLNHGRPQPLQYVVNAAFLATLYSDYLDAADTPGWYCGPKFYSTDVLREFAKTQVCCNMFFFKR